MATVEDIRPLLHHIRAINMFRYMSDAELDDFLDHAEVVRYGPNETIITQGEVGDYFFAVVHGSVNVSVRELQKEEVVLSHLQAGDMFGEAAVFLRETRSANVRSAEETVAIRINRQEMMNFIRANPTGGNKVLMVIILSLLAKLKRTNQELAFEKQSEIDFEYVDALIEEFMMEI